MTPGVLLYYTSSIDRKLLDGMDVVYFTNLLVTVPLRSEIG